MKYNALNVVKDGFRLFDNALEVDDTDDFCNPKTRISIDKLCSSDKEETAYLGKNTHKDTRVCGIMNGRIYHLQLLIFGYDELGQSSYI